MTVSQTHARTCTTNLTIANQPFPAPLANKSTIRTRYTLFNSISRHVTGKNATDYFGQLQMRQQITCSFSGPVCKAHASIRQRGRWGQQVESRYSDRLYTTCTSGSSLAYTPAALCHHLQPAAQNSGGAVPSSAFMLHPWKISKVSV